jgi:hypothetical protein
VPKRCDQYTCSLHYLKRAILHPPLPRHFLPLHFFCSGCTLQVHASNAFDTFPLYQAGIVHAPVGKVIRELWIVWPLQSISLFLAQPAAHTNSARLRYPRPPLASLTTFAPSCARSSTPNRKESKSRESSPAAVVQSHRCIETHMCARQAGSQLAHRRS